MRVIFCLPGKTISHQYFNSWNSTIHELAKHNIAYAYCMDYDPVVYYTRNRILGGDNTKGKDQLPWQGQIDYEYQIWIDNDIVWKPDDVLKLIKHDKPIVSGCYHMANGHSYPIVETLDFEHLENYGTFQFMNDHQLSQKTEPFNVSYVGFGFVVIKKGVIESMEYPWFHPRWISNNKFHDFCAEDVGFCWTAKEKGIEILVDPTVRVGHEKITIL